MTIGQLLTIPAGTNQWNALMHRVDLAGIGIKTCLDSQPHVVCRLELAAIRVARSLVDGRGECVLLIQSRNEANVRLKSKLDRC